MAGRGGRGAALRQIFESMEAKKLEEENQRPGPSSQSDHQPGPSQIAQSLTEISAPPKPRGRGMLLQALTQKIGDQHPALRPSPSVEPPTQEIKELTIAKPLPDETVHYRSMDGDVISIMVNYIDLKISDTFGMFEYKVKFEPEVDSVGLRSALFRRSELVSRCSVFDGSALYLPRKLDTDIKSGSAKTNEGQEHKVTIIFKQQRNLTENVHFYNNLFRKVAKMLNLVQCRDCLFDPTGKMAIPRHKLEIWPGYVTAIDVYEGGLKLQIDTASKVLRTNTCLELINEVLEREGGQARQKIKELLIGQVVITRYNNKTYRIDDVDFDQNPAQLLPGNEKATYIDYYLQKYNISILDKSQPILISTVKRNDPRNKNKEASCYIAGIVPEIAYLTGLSDAMRNDFQVTKDVAVFTRVSPNQKLLFIRKYFDNVRNNKEVQELLKGWGIVMGSGLERLDGRICRAEEIIVGNGDKLHSKDADWNREIGRKSALFCVDFSNWVVIHSKRDTRNAENFISFMKTVCRNIGIPINKPVVRVINDDNIPSYIKELEKMPADTQFVVVIFNQPRTDKYSAIKRYLCCDKPIPSQVINSRTISREDKMNSIVMKIALQINCKLGGSLWSVKIPYDRSMVVGIDVYHEGQGSTSKNFVGMVASMNRDYTQYVSAVVSQTRGQEIIASLSAPFGEALTEYIRRNQGPPKQIFIFRDGVSDGQLRQVSDIEIPLYQNILKTILSELPNVPYETNITFVVVQKRINTKIFSINDDRGNNLSLGNPPPGTIVDHSVTRRTLKDFFLVSQNVRQGTVTPSHYIVVKDDNNCQVTHIQRLSYKLCHLYYNWPGTIRVPMICQYAHRIAYLTGMHLKRAPSKSLSDKLFYL